MEEHDEHQRRHQQHHQHHQHHHQHQQHQQHQQQQQRDQHPQPQPHPHPHHHSNYPSAWDDDDDGRDDGGAGGAAEGHVDVDDDDINVDGVVEVEPEPIGVGGDPYLGALAYSPQPSPSPPPVDDVVGHDDMEEMEQRRRLVQQVTAMTAAQEALRYQREGAGDGGVGGDVYQGNDDVGGGGPQDEVEYQHAGSAEAYGVAAGPEDDDAVAAYHQQQQQQQQYHHYGPAQGIGDDDDDDDAEAEAEAIAEQQQHYGYEEQQQRQGQQQQQHEHDPTPYGQEPTPATTQTQAQAQAEADEGGVSATAGGPSEMEARLQLQLEQYRQLPHPQAYDDHGDDPDPAALDPDDGGAGGGCGAADDGRADEGEDELYHRALQRAGYHDDDVVAAAPGQQETADPSAGGAAAATSYEQQPAENPTAAAASSEEVEAEGVYLRLQQRYPHLLQAGGGGGDGDGVGGGGGGGGEETTTAATTTEEASASASTFPPPPMPPRGEDDDEQPVASSSSADADADAAPATATSTSHHHHHRRGEEEAEAAMMNSMSDADVRAVATVATMAAAAAAGMRLMPGVTGEEDPAAPSEAGTTRPDEEGGIAADSQGGMQEREERQRQQEQQQQRPHEQGQEHSSIDPSPAQYGLGGGGGGHDEVAMAMATAPPPPHLQIEQHQQQGQQEEEKVVEDEQSRLAGGRPYLASGEGRESQYEQGPGGGGAVGPVAAGAGEGEMPPPDGGVQEEKHQPVQHTAATAPGDESGVTPRVSAAPAPPPSPHASSPAVEVPAAGGDSGVAAAVAAAAASAGVVVEGEGEEETGVVVVGGDLGGGASRAAARGAAPPPGGGDREAPVAPPAATPAAATGRDGVVRGLGGEEDDEPPPPTGGGGGGGVDGAVAVVPNLPSPEQRPWQAHDPTAGDVDFVTAATATAAAATAAATTSPPGRSASGGVGVLYSPQEALDLLGAGTRIPADGLFHDRKIFAYVGDKVGPDVVQCQTVTARGKPCANVAAVELTYDGVGDKRLYCHLHTLHQLNKERGAAGGGGGLRTVRFLFDGGWGVGGSVGGLGGGSGAADGSKVRRRTKKTASKPPDPRRRHRSVLESDDDGGWRDSSSLTSGDNLVTYRVDLTRPLGATFTDVDDGGDDVAGGTKSVNNSSVYDEVRASMKMEPGTATSAAARVARANEASGVDENQERPAIAPVAAVEATDAAGGGRGRPDGGADVSTDEVRAAPQDRHRGPDGSESVGEPSVSSKVEKPPPPPQCPSGAASADRAEEKENSTMPERTKPTTVEADAVAVAVAVTDATVTATTSNANVDRSGKEGVDVEATADTGAEATSGVIVANGPVKGDTVSGADRVPTDGTADKGDDAGAANDAGVKKEGTRNNKLERWKIRDVHPQSQAFQLGMRAGQVITRVNSTDITTKDDLPTMIERAVEESLKRRQNGDNGDGDKSKDALDLVVFRHYPPAPDKVLQAGKFACRNGERKYTRGKRKRRAFPRNWDPWKAFPRSAGGGIRRVSVIPSGRIGGDTGTAETLVFSSVSWDDMRTKIEARVQRICDDFCLLRAMDDGGLIHFKDVSNLVFASLVHESPLPISMTKPTTETEASWFTDSKDKIVGPQPWVATRQFVLQNVYNMLEGEDQLDWPSSRSRRVVLGEKYTPIIEEYLKFWRPCLAESVWKDTLRLYAEKLWTRFSIDHLDMRNRDANANMRARRPSALRKLTWRWVEDEAERLASSGVCPSLPSDNTSNGSNGGISSMSGSDDAAALEKQVLACLHEIRYDAIPFARDLTEVARTALDKFRAAYINLKIDHISARTVRDVLDDLEDESDYLSQQNDVLKVRFKWSSLRPYTGVHRVASYDISSSYSPSQRSQSSDEWEEEGRRSSSSVDYKSPAKSKKRSRYSPSTGASAAAEGDSGRLSNTVGIGARVYAEFTNGSYYWGQVKDITFTKTKEPRYNVLFDDGDMLKGLNGDKMCTEAEFVESFGTQPPPPPKAASASTKRKNKRPRPSSGNTKQERGRSVNSAVNMLSELSRVGEVAPTVTLPDFGRPLTLSELLKYRCKRCELCKRRDCEHCYSCRRNKSGDNKTDEEVCLQKMCCNIEDKYKAQPADLGGFPPGWTFLFHAPKMNNFRSVGHQHEALNGLKIMSPNGRLYRSIESAATCKVVDGNIVNNKFFEHVGVVLVEKSDKDHSLVGKRYKAEWTDVNGFHKAIFGRIVTCSEDWRDNVKHESFNVQYSEESRAVMRQFSSSGSVGGLEVIPTQTLSCALAWGGCILSERSMVPKDAQDSDSLATMSKAKPFKCWVAPDMRKEELVENASGKSFPRLTLIFRGCKLVFSVKESSIPNAGYGVFVKSIPLDSDYRENEDDPIRLRSGELLDIGVYAPFRQEDIKHESIFKLKNYIHSMACEEWCFDATKDDYQYDITDEVTGKVHALAQKHIPMYVNECKMNETPTIYAEHDPEGSVHYLFGIEYNGDSDKYETGMRKLRRKLLDGEQEVFVNYGLEYERVRVRKGYSALPKSEKSQVMETIETDDIEYIKEIDAFDTENLAMCMGYFQESFLNESRGEKMEQLNSDVKARALGVLKRIQTRLARLTDESKTDIEEGGVVSDEVNAYGKQLSELLHFSDDLIERTKALSCRKGNLVTCLG